MGYTVQAIGLTVQNFLSAAVGIAVVAALIRGLMRRHTDRLGNFWVDLTRLTLRLLLPLSFLAALVLVISGVIQNLNPPTDVATLAGNTQTLPGGLIASQEAIKELGTNGGGYLNANSAHPFENPTAFTNLFEIFLLLAIPFSLPRTFGTMAVWSHWWRGLTRTHRLVRYDERGSGLSDWDVPPGSFTLDAWVHDLETVVDTIGLTRFPLLGMSQGGPIAVRYAARHPERVSHLIVYGTCARATWARATEEERRELAALGELIRVSGVGPTRLPPGLRRPLPA